MGHHEQREVEPVEDLDEVAASGRVEVRGRLVQHEQLGAHGQDRGDGDATALPEAEVVRGTGAVVGHADLVECAVDGGVQVRAGHAEVGRSEGHVVAHGRHEQLVVGVLEDDADPAADLPKVRLLDE